MNGNLYPLAKSYFGVEHVAVLDNVVLSTALSLPTLSEAPLALDVVEGLELLPDRAHFVLDGARAHAGRPTPC